MNARQVVGVAALACLACCIGPILGVLGGIAALGVLSSAFIGVGGLAIAAVAVLTFVLVRKKRRPCAVAERETPVTLITGPRHLPTSGRSC